MNDVPAFGAVVAFAALALAAAIVSNRVGAVLRVPAPAIFLVAAAVASDLAPRLGGLSIVTDQRLVTVALILILFDGGVTIGLTRVRTAAGAIVWLGVVGTAVTAAALALLAHLLFGLSWRSGLLVGTALAPTDPAVVFSVLGGKEIAGRSGTLLEGESGANDPVGIALMASILTASGGGLAAFGSGLREFAVEMAVGIAVGAAGGWLLRLAAQRLPLPDPALYPLRALAFAGLIYGGAAVAHGSGFLAVFLAGIVVGDVDAPGREEVTRVSGVLGTLAEIVAFTVLGLTVSLREVRAASVIVPGIVLAVLLILVVRPVLVGAVLLPVRLTLRERAFVLWAGLKGAVPILLGTFLLAEHVPEAHRLYGIIFVVVLISVVVQGGAVPAVARVLRIPMR